MPSVAITLACDHPDDVTVERREGKTQLDTADAFNQFFTDVERRAYRMAHFGLGHKEEALDAVQDAMMKLVERYAARPQAEWRPLFYTILQSRIRDRQRRNAVRRRWQGWIGSALQHNEETDPIQLAVDNNAREPGDHMDQAYSASAIDTALTQLPLRQQQCFMLRIWEGLDVKATAQAMKCSEGSVKTHLSRAMQALRKSLKDFRP
ncbi:MAG: RNA polymerase sigma factor [Gammaproteobacteria bacterium]|nr:MAG: RNA polymerase sigma factor [Gammaproteobacteria bacterium]